MEQKAASIPLEHRASSTGFWLLLLLPIFYLLSSGPGVALAERSGNKNLLLTVAGFYEPIVWLHEHTALAVPLGKYYYLCGGKGP